MITYERYEVLSKIKEHKICRLPGPEIIKVLMDDHLTWNPSLARFELSISGELALTRFNTPTR